MVNGNTKCRFYLILQINNILCFIVNVSINCLLSKCLLFTGTELETEGKDRADLSLPGFQLQLLQDAVQYGWFKSYI